MSRVCICFAVMLSYCCLLPVQRVHGMHAEARAFLTYVSSNFSSHFHGEALDVGSMDINGNNREFFHGRCRYTGCDVLPGNNVDVALPVHMLPHADASFDVVMSTEALEHDMHYVASLHAMYRLLKPGGLLVVTCASYGRGAHGTRWRFPEVSLTSQVEEGGWSDYYMNIGPAEVAAVLPEHAWSYFRFFYRKSPGDMYMVAIKTGGLHSFLDVKEFSLFDALAQEVDPYALREL